MTNLSRRSLITGLISFAATAPVIVRATSLMPVKSMTPSLAFSPVYFQDRMFWVTKDQPTLVHWSGRALVPRWVVQQYKVSSAVRAILEAADKNDPFNEWFR